MPNIEHWDQNQTNPFKETKNPFEITYQFSKTLYTRLKIKYWKKNKAKRRERGKALLTIMINFLLDIYTTRLGQE